jgi:quercetin 2,3-dioxygenase
MQGYRKVEHIFTAPQVMMGSIRLRQAIPLSGLEQISPFILLHHFDLNLEPGDQSFNVPAHPHRGFCPITFMYEGSIAHNDSLGNSKVISDNEVQWINAARGIIHSEEVDKDFAAKGGRYQGIQLWINLPAADKMKAPSYQPITKEEIVLIEKDGVEFRLISGNFDGKKGPAQSNVLTATMRMKQGSNFSLSFPADQNVVFYLLEGSIKINESEVAQQYGLIVFEHSEETITLEAQADAKLLIMAGAPIHEPLVSHGPFVMNNQTEILEAMRDYQDGKMGHLY